MSKDKTTNLRQSVRSTLPANVSGSHSVPSSAASSLAIQSDVLGDGISGSAMSLPPPKPATCAVRLDNTVRTTKTRPRNPLLASKSDTSNCKMKPMKEDADDQGQELRDLMVHLYYCFPVFALFCLVSSVP